MWGSLMLAPIILIATSNFSSLHSGADTRASDNSDMNPFMLAIEKGHLGVVKMMMEKDPDPVSLSVSSGSTVIYWALEKGCHGSSFFEIGFCVSLSAMLCYNHLFSYPINDQKLYHETPICKVITWDLRTTGHGCMSNEQSCEC